MKRYEAVSKNFLARRIPRIPVIVRIDGKNCEELQEMLFSKHKINWAKLPQGQKSGFICYKEKKPKVVYMRGTTFSNETICERNSWEIYPSMSNKAELDIVINRVTLFENIKLKK